MRRSTALMVSALLLLALSLATAVPHDERSEEVETRRMFRDWMTRFEKNYSSIDEEEHRYAVFKENLHVFGDLTREHGGLNVFGDLTHEELRVLYTGCTHGDGGHKYSLLYWINKYGYLEIRGTHNLLLASDRSASCRRWRTKFW